MTEPLKLNISPELMRRESLSKPERAQIIALRNHQFLWIEQLLSVKSSWTYHLEDLVDAEEEPDPGYEGEIQELVVDKHFPRNRVFQTTACF